MQAWKQLRPGRAATVALSIVALGPVLHAGAAVDGCLTLAALTERVDCLVEQGGGSTQLVWVDAGGQQLWSAAVDAGDGQLESLAAELLDSGKKDEALALIERALSLGAGPNAEEVLQRARPGQVSGAAASPAPLMASPWFRPLPALQITTLDGDTVDLAAARGRVLVLDFWATWCQPCLRELPHLQRLHADLGHRGMQALTINADEPDRVVRRFARQIGLTLPIGRYDDAVDDAFHVRSLPTVILADREGRIRARWDGYREGLEQEIARRVRALLQGDEESAPHRVAGVLAGRGVLRAEWVRDGGLPIEGLAFAPETQDGARLHLLRPGLIASLDRDAVALSRINFPRSAGRLRGGDLNGDGRAELVGFRSGGSEVVVLDREIGAHRTWRSPAPILGLDLTPAARDDPGQVVLATSSGLFHFDLASDQVKRLGSHEFAAIDVAVAGSGASVRVLAIGEDGAVRSYDREGRPLGRWSPGNGGGRLIGNRRGSGFGVGPESISGAAVGQFLPGGGHQVALATSSAQLVVLDLESGAQRFRARWPEITDLAAGDLDGDGRDELLVASGPQLTLLSAGP